MFNNLMFIKNVYKAFIGKTNIFHMDDIITMLLKNPQIDKINHNIPRDEGYYKSLEMDFK